MTQDPQLSESAREANRKQGGLTTSAPYDHPFRLFDLPRELRDQIYDYLVYDRIIVEDPWRPEDGPPARVITNDSRIPQASWVSRRFREEYHSQVPHPSRTTVQWITYHSVRYVWQQSPVGMTDLSLDTYIFCKACLQHDGFGSSPYCMAHNFIDTVLLHNVWPDHQSLSLKIGFLTWCVGAMGFTEFKREHSHIFMQLEELAQRTATLEKVEIIKYSGMESFHSIQSGESWRYTLASWSRDDGWKAAPGRE